MKSFETPIIEVVVFTVEDVLTTSDPTGGIGGDNEMDRDE